MKQAEMREFFELIRADQISFYDFRAMLDAQHHKEYNRIWEDGRDAGYRTGWADAMEQEAGEYQRGYDEGRAHGFDAGHEDGYQTGYEDGNSDGWDRGREDGLREASQA